MMLSKLALDAALEVDNYILGRPVTFNHVPQLIEALTQTSLRRSMMGAFNRVLPGPMSTQIPELEARLASFVERLRAVPQAPARQFTGGEWAVGVPATDELVLLRAALIAMARAVRPLETRKSLMMRS